ncbi:probable serine/threonine-protein kinase nek3 [Mytilus californianus]|uniref:probable serine/threonine-protein kinase nek3 n=1 Tax=Mytilus californianus TaxID=6549 RepID=UPI0022463795|nr:probable serine/threonine-protein kinase nek3 [Mytilus californianus]
MTGEKGGGDDKDGYEMVAIAENDNTLESFKEETDTHNLSVVSNDNSLMEIRETDFKDFKKQNSFNMFRSASGQELTKKNLETGRRQGSWTSLVSHARRMSEPTMTIELQEEKVQPPSAKYEENYPDNDWYYVEDQSDFTFPNPPEESQLNKIFNSVEKEERFYENYMRNNTGKAATVDGMWHEDSPAPRYEDKVITERNNNKIDFNISFENIQQQSNRRLPSVDDSSKYAVKLSESYHKPGHEMTKTYELKNFLDKFSTQPSTENLQDRGQNRQQYHWSNSQEDQSRSNDNVLQNVSRRLSFEENVKQNESEAKEQNTPQPQFIKGSRENRSRDGQTDEIKSQDIEVSPQRIEEQNPHYDEDDDGQIRMVHRKTFLSPQKRLVRGSPGGISNQSRGTTGHMSIQSPQTPGNMSSQSHGTPGHMSGQSQSTPDHMSSQSPVTPGHMSSQSPQTSGHIYSLSHGTPDHMSSQSSGTPGHMSGQSPQKPGYISSQNPSTPSNLSSQSHGTPGYISSQSPQTPSNISSQSHGTPGYISSRRRVTPSNVSSQSHGTPDPMSSRSPQTPGYVTNQSHGTTDQISNQSRGTPDQISNQIRGTPDQISNQIRGTPDQISTQSRGTPDQISNQSRGTPDQISTQSRGTPDQISNQSPHTTSFMNNQIRRVPINMTNQTPAIPGHISSQSYSSPGRMSSQTPATPDNMSGQRPITLGQIISQRSATPDYMSGQSPVTPGQMSSQSPVSLSHMSGQSPVTPGQMSSQSPVSLSHMFGQSPVTLGPITRYSNSTLDDINNQSHETRGWMADSAPIHLNNQSQSEPSQMTDQSLGLTSMRTIQNHGTPGSSKNKGMTDAFQFGEYSDDMVYRSPNKNRANQRQELEPIEIEVEMSKKYRNNVKAGDTPGLPPMYLTSTPNKQTTEHYEHVLSEEGDVLFHQREAYDTANKSNNERNEFLKEIHDDIFQCIIQTNDSGKMDINAGRLDDDVSNCQTGHQLSPISEESTEQRHSGEFVQTLSGQHSEEFIVPRIVIDEEENEIRLDQLSNQGNDMDSTLQYNSSRSNQASASESGTSSVSENLDSLHSHLQTPEQ